jgi:hypothetical protein
MNDPSAKPLSKAGISKHLELYGQATAKDLACFLNSNNLDIVQNPNVPQHAEERLLNSGIMNGADGGAELIDIPPAKRLRPTLAKSAAEDDHFDFENPDPSFLVSPPRAAQVSSATGTELLDSLDNLPDSSASDSGSDLSEGNEEIESSDYEESNDGNESNDSGKLTVHGLFAGPCHRSIGPEFVVASSIFWVAIHLQKEWGFCPESVSCISRSSRECWHRGQTRAGVDLWHGWG